MMFGGPPPATAYFDGGILNFVFAEMWMRPGLDQRARRWITLIGVSESSSEIPIRSHVHSAMASGHATRDEMNALVLRRSEERRGGEEWVSTCRSLWWLER